MSSMMIGEVNARVNQQVAGQMLEWQVESGEVGFPSIQTELQALT